MLTVSRYIWTADKSIIESGIHQYRLQPKAYYDRKFDPGTESMMFDILAPFFTLADIKHSYDRFNNEIFGIAQQCADSLYNKLHQNVVDDGRSYLSRACLRNAEVIDDLFTKMQSQRGQYRTTVRLYSHFIPIWLPILYVHTINGKMKTTGIKKNTTR